MLSGTQPGITVTGLVVGFIAEPSVSALLEPALTGIGIPEGAVGGIFVVPADSSSPPSSSSSPISSRSGSGSASSRSDSELITRSLTEPETPVGDLAVPAAEITSVDADAGTEDILCTAADHDRTRLLVRDRGTVLGSVHARDALVARARGRTTTARTPARPVPELTEDTTVADAIDVLRRNRASLAVIRDDTGRPTALVNLDDLLARYLQPRVV